MRRFFTGLLLASFFAAVCLASCAVPTPAPQPAGDGVVNGWAILAEKDDYSDVEVPDPSVYVNPKKKRRSEGTKMADLPVDYVNVTRLRQRLRDAGWPESHIRELREFDREDLRQGVNWLATNADEDDVVFCYVFAHGMYLRQVVYWSEFFADDWAKVPSQRRVLVVDSCQAALLTNAVEDDPRPHLSIAAVDEWEFGWAGLEEEGLPIIGAVFTHYFVTAFATSEADADRNGRVSIQEAARHAEGQQRTYMHEVVLVVPEFTETYHKLGVYPERDPEFPHVVVDDAIGAPVYLELGAR